MYYFDNSRLWLIYTLWTALLLGGTVVTVRLLLAAIKDANHRWSRLTGAAVIVAVTLAVASAWIYAATIGRYSCTMDSLSTALASAADTAADHTCVHKSRLRVGLSSGVELCVVAGGIWLAGSSRDRRRTDAGQMRMDATSG